MAKLDYMTIPEETPDSRNNDFYEEISRNWEKRAKNLQNRRWHKIQDKDHA